MKVLVTGGAGHLGANLLRRLQADGGCEIRALARRSDNNEGITSAGVEIVYGDLRDLDSLRAACKGIDRDLSRGRADLDGRGQGRRALPEQRHRHQEPLAGGARSRLRARRRHRQLQRRRPPRRRLAVGRDGAVQPVRQGACPTRSRSRRSSSSACAPSPRGRTWSSPPRARSSGRTTTCRRAWARVLRRLRRRQAARVHPGRLRVRRRARHLRRPRARHAEGAHRPQVHHLVGLPDDGRHHGHHGARHRQKAPAPSAGVADGGDRAHDAAGAVDAVSRRGRSA